MSRPLLLIAEPLLAQGLCRLIQEALPDTRVSSTPQELGGSPALVLWLPDASMPAGALTREARHLADSWEPAALLLVLPQALAMNPEQILALPAAGLLQAPSSAELLSAVETVLQGGRVVQLNAAPQASAHNPDVWMEPQPPLGLGQWLLLSGLQQIDAECKRCDALLQASPASTLLVLVLQGRRRELLAARRLLLLLWGPASLAWGADSQPGPPTPAEPAAPALSLSLSQRNAEGTWQSIRARLQQRIAEGAGNRSGQLLALEALHPSRRSDLLLALLEQLQTLRDQVLQSSVQPRELSQHWLDRQTELRQVALRRMASPYVRLPRNGELQAVADSLIQQCPLQGSDPEIPDPQPMLQALVLGQPLLVEGQLLAPDAPLAVLHLEQLLSNWLVRTAEQVSAEVLGCCAAWPELRRYLLVEELLSTRNLERLRNQLNAQQRWSSWMERPVLIYESKRQLLTLGGNGIAITQLTEPRDSELKQLSWGQQLVTLALETRDALGPQLQSLIQAIGRLVVLVLTRIVGRAIGLIGRGILQGLGRAVQRG
mgnify:FL=1